MRKWYYRAAIIGSPVFLAFLSISCKKTKTFMPEKLTEPGKWLHFIVQINTDSLDLNRIEDQKVLDRWADQTTEILSTRLNLIERSLELLGKQQKEVREWTSITRDAAQKDRLVVKTPYIDEDAKNEMIFILSRKGVIGIKLKVDGPFLSKEALLSVYNGNIPDFCEIGTGVGGYYLIKNDAVIISEDIKNISVTSDSSGNYAVSITLYPEGAEKMLGFSSGNIGKEVAFVYDEVILAMPRIEGKIADKFNLYVADSLYAAVLAALLKFPVLPAPIQIIGETIEKGSQK